MISWQTRHYPTGNGTSGGSDGGSDGGADLLVPSLIHGGAGNDHLQGGRGNDAIFGGDGDDHLSGGAGNDILLGGAGRDKLDGGAGRDLLIGGLDKDDLKGHKGDDILIGGVTQHDSNLAALDAIMAEWGSSRSYQDRVANLNGTGTGPHLNDSYYLIASGLEATVFDDGAKDTLKGDKGLDWFFAHLSESGDDDRVKDWKKNNEILDLIFGLQ